MHKPKNVLLSRDKFRDSVFERDANKCVFCAQPAVDAHHILERRLWPDGGYYLNNGASVCEKHHIECEQTTLSVEAVREACGIKHPLLPPHLYPDHIYDKWGNPVMPNGQRLRGELFFDESVQKILAKGQVLNDFTNRVKYSRTSHLPWSQGMHADDRLIDSMQHFIGKRVICTRKMDGENTSLYRDYLHARSVDSRGHPSRDWVKGFWAQICGDIPDDWRVCGENLFAVHSIAYSNLKSYFLGFSVWNERNICLSWDESKEWFDLLGVQPVEVIYDGIYDEAKIKALWHDGNWATEEGYVMRVADAFAYGEFKDKVAKFVRKNHVQTNKHWMRGQRVIPNELA
ncbi:RNA ligase family protein [Comamonas thiooxydans]|uniref:RNA ligase family protein n=1 Tax=Comamonas thiooxydans TaxID=363952 RepID=UPI000B4126EC|nr:RNA ligase family protein [Comamonas thiooxydans]